MSQPMLPFSRPAISEAAISDVVAVLRSGWITSGAKVLEFERAFAEAVGARHAVAVSSAPRGSTSRWRPWSSRRGMRCWCPRSTG